LVFSDLQLEEYIKDIHLDLVVPILANKGNGPSLLGAFLIRIDPDTFLFPLVQAWPTPSPTAEIMLVRREGNEVVILNELRHKQGTALSLRFPLDREKLPAVMAAQGRAGVVEGLDYRGVPVLAALRPVPDSPWFLVAKIDQTEAYEQIYRGAWLIGTITGISILASGLAAGFLWRHQRARFFRREYELELQQEKLLQRSKFLSRYANDIILLLNSDLKIIEANERAVQTYGYTHDELLQMNLKDLHAPEAQAALGAQMDKVRELNGMVLETRHRKKDGTSFPVESSDRLIKTKGEAFYQCIIRDISERKLAEEKLRESQRQLSTLIGNMPGMVYRCAYDRNWTMEYVSDGCLALTGYQPEELIGSKTIAFNELILPEYREYLYKKWNKILSRKEIFTEEYRIITKDGTEKWVWEQGCGVYSEKGQVLFLEGVITDVSERRKLEAQLLHAQKMESLGQLAGGIAHDFNNILTAIMGYAGLLTMKMRKDDPLRRNAEQILASSERAAHLTSSILAFSRKQIIHLKPVNLTEVIKGVEKLLLKLLGERIQFKTVFADEDLVVMADSNQLEQVFMNLIINARDAMPNGGLLMVETERIVIDKKYKKTHGYGEPGDYALISVADTGPGMDEKTRARIFEPFFTTKEVGKGTGLGLSIVYGIIKQHNGYINVYSEIGKGTTFKIYLPLSEKNSEYSKHDFEDHEVSAGTETLLLAEDDTEVREFTKYILEESGYTVIESRDGDDAVDKFMENKGEIQLLLLDVIMPGKNGKEVYHEISRENPDVKVLFMSGYTANIIHKKGILDDGLDVILKPVSPRKLLQKIREVLDRSA
jgi:PAS domain S-box-containing protein